MGWARGSILADYVWDLIDSLDGWDNVDCSKAEVALDIVSMFEDHDCDTMYECAFVEDLLEYDEDKNEWKVISDES